MSQFEREIKQLLENYEAPVDNSAWSSMEQKMNGGSSSSFFRQFVVAGSILTVAMIGLTMDYNSEKSMDHADHLAETNTITTSDNSQHNTIKLEDVATKNNSNEPHLNASEGDAHNVVITEEHIIKTKKVASSDKVSTKNLSDLEKENIIGINASIKDKSTKKKSPVTEYVGDYFNLDANMTLTPNGDNNNDVFLPDALEAADNFIMKIFDKNGAMIFSSSSLDNPWTGYNQITGNQTEDGKYRWKVTLDNNNRREIFTGKIIVKN